MLYRFSCIHFHRLYKPTFLDDSAMSNRRRSFYTTPKVRKLNTVLSTNFVNELHMWLYVIVPAQLDKVRATDGVIIVKHSSDTNLESAIFHAKITGDHEKPPVVKEVSCNENSTNCIIAGLAQNTAYQLSLRMCSNNNDTQTCSNWSSPLSIYTLPSRKLSIWHLKFTSVCQIGIT